MPKINYFETLDRLAELASSAVAVAVNTCTSPTLCSQISPMREECDKLVLKLEDSLFSDFLPPLERNNIAACAHFLSRVIEYSRELAVSAEESCIISSKKWNKDGEICVELAEALKAHTAMLSEIRKPSKTPELKEFRKLLSDGHKAHVAMLKKLRSGSLPRSYFRPIILTARLRSELSRAFDELVEIMLNNI